MNMKRRKFLQQIGSTAMLTSIGSWPLMAARPQYTRLVILHTNDVHSRIDPFPMDGGRNQGKGGAKARAQLISGIRRSHTDVLLLDSGDIFQGTPYFNFFAGEIEMKLMSAMRYDAATLGNHDFDAGVDGLVKQLPHATFPFVNCNYNIDETALSGKIRSYTVIPKGRLRIGIFGLGIELQGLVPEKLYAGVKYQDPVSKAQSTADHLKFEERCDYIICLSHLGYRYSSAKIDDVKLARTSRHIDLILGGHTHTFLPQAVNEINSQGQPILINQVGWAGLVLGRIDVLFERNRRGKCTLCANTSIG